MSHEGHHWLNPSLLVANDPKLAGYYISLYLRSEDSIVNVIVYLNLDRAGLESAGLDRMELGLDRRLELDS